MCAHVSLKLLMKLKKIGQQMLKIECGNERSSSDKAYIFPN